MVVRPQFRQRPVEVVGNAHLHTLARRGHEMPNPQRRVQGQRLRHPFGRNRRGQRQEPLPHLPGFRAGGQRDIADRPAPKDEAAFGQVLPAKEGDTCLAHFLKHALGQFIGWRDAPQKCRVGQAHETLERPDILSIKRARQPVHAQVFRPDGFEIKVRLPGPAWKVNPHLMVATPVRLRRFPDYTEHILADDVPQVRTA